ncbi:hypothetical protein P7K49_033837 [Saguinus oedipus]|uniref:Peptidase M12B propeptide domain-containing protein n=1 Tax=Saguinus oedipus TaxID=9490 RepID=A0ABQ9TTX5_SAGOE|nr:hypothetical protein P7K49_033837 [Saguinus oedipus]
MWRATESRAALDIVHPVRVDAGGSFLSYELWPRALRKRDLSGHRDAPAFYQLQYRGRELRFHLTANPHLLAPGFVSETRRPGTRAHPGPQPRLPPAWRSAGPGARGWSGGHQRPLRPELWEKQASVFWLPLAGWWCWLLPAPRVSTDESSFHSRQSRAFSVHVQETGPTLPALSGDLEGRPVAEIAQAETTGCSRTGLMTGQPTTQAAGHLGG